MPLNRIEEALEQLRQGRMVVVIDDENRENEGDLLMAADCCTPQDINFMTRYGRGLICMPMQAQRLQELNLPPMTAHASDPRKTAFTVSVDIKSAQTGISAFERAATIRRLADPASRAEDFTVPGHIFPLCAQAGGVLTRKGHTEAAVDLSTLAGHSGAGVICEILREDGSMARLADLETFCQRHDLCLVSIEDLIRWRKSKENYLLQKARVRLPTAYGAFEIAGFENRWTGKEHLALVYGQVEGKSQVMTRVHSECLTGDVFGSRRCDCGSQLEESMRLIARQDCGVLVYLRQEGRGIGLLNKLRAYELQDQGIDTCQANVALGFKEDERDYEEAAMMLKSLGVQSVRLITHNPRKAEALQTYGMPVSEWMHLPVCLYPENKRYLRAKQTKMGHLLDIPL